MTYPELDRIVMAAAFAACVVACGSSDGETAAPGDAGSGIDSNNDAGVDATEGDASLDGGGDAQSDVPVQVDAEAMATVTILYTGEERGRVLPEVEGSTVFGGAANIAGWWDQVEGYSPETHLVLSGGDSLTGPATSNWSKGANVVEVMGLMGYRATALGRRDYDFGRSALYERIDEAPYAYLSANTLYEDTGAVVDYVVPTMVVPINGVQVGIIGLMDLMQDANPADVNDLEFAEYVPTVESYALELRAAGAQILVVLASADPGSMLDMVDALTVPVDAVLTDRGSYNPPGSGLRGATIVAVTGGLWRGYQRVTLMFDIEAQQVVERAADWVAVQYEQAEGNPVVPDPAVTAAVEQWEQLAAQDLDREIAYTEAGVVDGTWMMANWVTDSWLWAFPEADLAIQNSGGLQASVASGPITVADIWEMLPYENYIVQVEMPGAKVQSSLQAMQNLCMSNGCFVPVAGIHYDVNAPDLAITLDDGTPLDPDATYTVLLNSYMYAGQAGFPFDPSLEPVATGQHMRDPVLAWTEQLNTSSADPLEDHLDPVPRNQ